jgi:formate dehydrogenase assembly factor FdhD
MDSEIEKVPVVRLGEEGRSNIEDIVAREFPLTIILNNQELVTLLCSPKDLNYLAIGSFLRRLTERIDRLEKQEAAATISLTSAELHSSRLRCWQQSRRCSTWHCHLPC